MIIMIFMHELCTHLSHPLFQVDIENSSFAQVSKFEQVRVYPFYLPYHCCISCMSFLC